MRLRTSNAPSPLPPLLSSVLEDYAVLYFGSAFFKIVRLLLVALL